MSKLAELRMLGLEDTAKPKDETHYVFTVRDRIIEHDSFTKAVRAIARAHERWTLAKVPAALLIYGQSGCGKSTVLRYYLQKFPRKTTPRKTIIPVLKVVTPEAPTVRSFTEAILVALGDSAAARGSAAVKTQRIMHFLRECEIQLLLIDEFHHFCDSNRTEYRRVTDWLKNLINECGIPVVLFGLPRAISALYSNEQLRRRFSSPIHLSEFGFITPAEQLTFRGILQHLQSLMPHQKGLYLSDPEVALRFHFATNGLIDYVVKIIDELVVASAGNPSPVVDYNALQEAFKVQIWADVPDKLNPFNSAVEPRRLNQNNEPFSIWDDPSAYTLSSRAKAATGTKKRSS
jgi:energy-coupling factor transporter ATP-binding protein EcfA2